METTLKRVSLILLTIVLMASAGNALANDPTPTPTETPLPTMTPTPIVQTLIPVGALQLFAGDQPPAGWLWCDGTAVGRTDYPLLFAEIGTTFGAGDGASTFNVPDCQGRVPVGIGWGTSLTPRNLGDQWGAETHQLTIAEMPSHSHRLLGYMPGSATSGFTVDYISVVQPRVWNSGYVESTGGNQPHNNMQPSIALGMIIWTGAVPLDLGITSGGSSGGGTMPTPTPGPEIIHYATVQVGEATTATAFSMSITAGEFVIALALFAIVGMMFVQMVGKAREA